MARTRQSRRTPDDGFVSLVAHAATQWLLNHLPLLAMVLFVWLAATVGFARQGVALGSFGYVVFGILAVLGKLGLDWLVWVVRQRHLYAEVASPLPSVKVLRKKFHAERERRATIRRQWPVACQRYDITDPDKMVPHLWRLRTDLAGDFSCQVFPARFVLKGGVEVVSTSASKIAQAVDCRDLLVRRNRNGFDLTFMWSDPLEGLLKVQDCPAAGIDGYLSFGRTVTGSAAVVLANLHFLVVGITGKGKSSTMHTLIADSIRQKIRLNLSVIDPKGGVEMDAYEPHRDVLNGTLLVRDYCSNGGPDSIKVLESIVMRMRARQATFKERGIRKWSTAVAGEFPLEVLFVDECLQVLRTWAKHKRPGETVQGGAMAMLTTELLAQGRAFGFVFWGLSQSGKVEDLYGARDLIPQRFCLGVSTLDAARMALGESTPGIERAVGLEPGRGVLYLEHEEGLTEVRVAYCDDADVARIASGKLPHGMGDGLAKSPVERICYVYLLRTRFGEAVYVGKGFVPEGRISHHLKGTGQLDAVQAAAVDEAMTRVYAFDSEREALAWERELIHRCRPLANKVHNGGNPGAGQAPLLVAPWRDGRPEVATQPVRVPGRLGRWRHRGRPLSADPVPRYLDVPPAAQGATQRRREAVAQYGGLR